MLPDLLDVVATYRPQLLIHDTSELPDRSSPRGWHPYVNHSFGHLLPDEIVMLAADWVARCGSAVGHQPPCAGGALPPPLSRHLSPSLHSGHRRVSPRGRRCGRCVRRRGGEQLPAWVDAMPPQPTVYVTLGTVFKRGAGGRFAPS